MKELSSRGASLHDYEAFIAIVDTGNLTRAAARLHRSLQSVSRSLSALEEHLGVVLIRRTTRRAQPTDSGLAFHRRVSAGLREIGLAEAELSDASGTWSGTLRLAGSAFFVGGYVGTSPWDGLGHRMLGPMVRSRHTEDSPWIHRSLFSSGAGLRSGGSSWSPLMSAWASCAGRP